MTSPIFALIAAAASLIAFAVVMRPLWRAKPRSAAIIIAGLALPRRDCIVIAADRTGCTMVKRRTPRRSDDALERSRDRSPIRRWVMLANAMPRRQTEQARMRGRI